MYPEFIAIYIGLAILSALMIVVLIFLLKLLKQSEVKQIPRPYVPAENQTAAASQTGAAPGGVVFCKRCATEFDASQKVCPRCGTPR